MLAPAGVTTWAQVAAGSYHTCAIASNGSAYCFGACPAAGLREAEAEGPTLTNRGPGGCGSGGTRLLGPLPDGIACRIGTGMPGSTACAWMRAGKGGSGQLGVNSATDSPVPVAVRTPAGVTAWAQVSAGYWHTCGRANATMSLWCWGASLAEGLREAEAVGPGLH